MHLNRLYCFLPSISPSLCKYALILPEIKINDRVLITVPERKITGNKGVISRRVKPEGEPLSLIQSYFCSML